MKIGYISDLHIDYNKQFNILQALINEIINQNIEVLLIGGDTSNSTVLTRSFVSKVIEFTGIQVHYIYGNHDYYTLDQGFHKDRELQNTFNPLIINGVGIIADTGWYDYRWYTRGCGQFNKLLRGHFGYGNTWPDHRFIKWPEDAGDDKSGRWFAQFSLEEMKKQNQRLDELRVTSKIVMTHMVPHEEFLLKQYEYLETNVFFGGQSLSDFIRGLSPDMVLFGHTHFSFDKEKDGTWYICSPLGYNFEWSMADADYEVKRKLVTFEL